MRFAEELAFFSFPKSWGLLIIVARCFESRPFGFVDPSNTRIVGLCTGMLAAGVIASSNTVADFMPLAIEAVRIAYRTGVQVSHISQTLVKDSTVGASWSSVVAGISEKGANQALDSFHQQAVC